MISVISALIKPTGLIILQHHVIVPAWGAIHPWITVCLLSGGRVLEHLSAHIASFSARGTIDYTAL